VSETTSALEAARIEVMKAVGYVQKTGQHGQGYSYASEGDLIRTLRSAMIQNGLTLCPVGVDVTAHRDAGKQLLTEAIVTYALRHTGGEEVRVAVLSTGADVGDKAAFKLMTGAEKYALRQAFLIETGDDPERDQAQQDRLRPGLSDEGKTVLAQKVAAVTDLASLKAAWDEYTLNDQPDATAADDKEVIAFFAKQKAKLKEPTNA